MIYTDRKNIIRKYIDNVSEWVYIIYTDTTSEYCKQVIICPRVRPS